MVNGRRPAPGTSGLYDFWLPPGSLAGQSVIQVVRTGNEM